MAWMYKTPGIPDSLFIRGDVPMTKEEVRAITLSKLRLFERAQVLDIGCGTGSVTIEMAFQCPKGTIMAMDQKEEAVSLTNQNIEAFGLKNIKTYVGSAPKDLPDQKFARIFIGGGSRKIEPIIKYASTHLKEGGIIAANTILLDSTYKILGYLKEYGFQEIDCVCVNIAKAVQSPLWMMKAYNPIYVISAQKETRKKG